MRHSLSAWSLVAMSSLALHAAEPAAPAPAKPKPVEQPTYTTVETAGPDYALQGEYEGPYQGGKLGAQVIALGNDQFHISFLKGGLPGDGWDLSARVEEDGKREGEGVDFSKGPWKVNIGAGIVKGKSADGVEFTLNHVERHSSTEGAQPPPGSLVLFDGTNADAWVNGKMDDRHLLQWGTKSKQAFKDFTLHIEFVLPFKPLARGQGRGNSGVYLQDRYEIQVLDSFGLKGLDNDCGGIYHQAAPKVNMCYPPLLWQTYDAEFTAAKFDESGKKTGNATLTLKHNGVLIHDHLEMTGPTPGGGLSKETPAPGPFQLQQHGNPVFYRNVWVVEKK